MFVEEPNIRLASYEPKQLECNRFEMDAFGREKGETFSKIKSSLGAKIGDGANTSAVFFGFAFFKN